MRLNAHDRSTRAERAFALSEDVSIQPEKGLGRIGRRCRTKKFSNTFV